MNRIEKGAGEPAEDNKLIQNLTDRAKEFQCLSQVQSLLHQDHLSPEEVFKGLIEILPTGWRYPELCRVRITYKDAVFMSPGFVLSEYRQEAAIELNGQIAGRLEMAYLSRPPEKKGSVFLPEEQMLLNSIADRLENYLFQKDLKSSMEQWEQAQQEIAAKRQPEWVIVIDLIGKMDSILFSKICRRMLNHLCWIGIDEAQSLMGSLAAAPNLASPEPAQEDKLPGHKVNFLSQEDFSKKIFEVAARYFSDEDILENIRKWMQEDKISFLIRVLEKTDTSLAEISDAVSRYHHLSRSNRIEISSYARSDINALFMERLFTEQLEYIRQARKFLDIDDFYKVLQRTIFPNNSHGKLGGKSAGLFIAEQILKQTKTPVRIPKTWYITSDYSMDFIYYNNLEEAMEQKYKDIEEVRADYPNLIQVFRNSNFPMDFINGISMALEDFGKTPIIVRSSSLLEDRYGTAFAGMYLSIFLPNQGTKEENLTALIDAIVRIYASIFGPDPIEYRKEHGLLEYHEEMAIIMQEVIGNRAGDYYFPTFAGVGFSENEFRWSPRIKREEGLLRIVPGMGTRAVDRLFNDYPILICPSQPTIRVNPSPEEAARYAPREMDVIDLKTNSFQTLPVKALLRELKQNYPENDKVFSAYQDNQIIRKNRFQIDYDKDDLIITMNGFIEDRKTIELLKYILKTLESRMNIPVDIEFAWARGELYLLQCRPQASSGQSAAVPIPSHIPGTSILFTADKYITNGAMGNISHVVYVDEEAYAKTAEVEKLERVGQAVGRLNYLLPKRQFILMGPGRWGSRGDITLGVKVNYSDINNTLLLVEIAREKGGYMPELSFGTHFFQDLVESSIRYLPLYPDEGENVFHRNFLTTSRNMLPELLPEYAQLEDLIYVVDIPQETGGKCLNVIMNGDEGKAVAFLAEGTGPAAHPESPAAGAWVPESQEDHWRWRLAMAERIAKTLDTGALGVKAFYVLGSSKNGTAGPESDIDLLIHVTGEAEKTAKLNLWLSGWSLCLEQVNYLRTGKRGGGVLDIQLITDKDLAENSSYAQKIGAVTDAALEIPVAAAEASRPAGVYPVSE
ncbi:MAG: nucleotidyltransferase domain-containing protein [Spirochaetales bacterium]|jgi:hypothetical protein|nr:nucleotidyltransferase domain-containing protein [Spirochaetales bacterium]